jgi:long-subunit acyl-CoA synthetase (AMP-forming)
VKIAEDGEIQRSNVMLGYYKDEKLTNEVVDHYFHMEI